MANILVAYFSATGTTGMAATALADAAGADLYEIQPEVPYTNDDLNWRDEQSRSSLEMNDPKGRPPIGGDKVSNMEQYETTNHQGKERTQMCCRYYITLIMTTQDIWPGRGCRKLWSREASRQFSSILLPDARM